MEFYRGCEIQRQTSGEYLALGYKACHESGDEYSVLGEFPTAGQAKEFIDALLDGQEE